MHLLAEMTTKKAQFLVFTQWDILVFTHLLIIILNVNSDSCAGWGGEGQLVEMRGCRAFTHAAGDAYSSTPSGDRRQEKEN